MAFASRLSKGLLVLAAAVAWPVVPGASASGTTTLTAGPGDSLAVQGSDLQCAVSATSLRVVSCWTGTEGSVRLHSYAVAVTDQGADIILAAGKGQVVAHGVNPLVPGPAFTGRAHKPTTYVLARGESVLVAGTHVVCGSFYDSTSRTMAVGCGVYAAGAYAVTVNDHFAALFREGKASTETVVALKKQP